MDLREPATIPVVFDLTRFLVSSITFMAHLRQVSVYLDDKQLAVLNKDAGLPTQVPMLSGLTPVSTTGYMKIEGLKSTRRSFVNSEVCSVLTTVTVYSPSHHRGSRRVCVQCRERKLWTGSSTSPSLRVRKRTLPSENLPHCPQSARSLPNSVLC
jgi:hypothetical protein